MKVTPLPVPAHRSPPPPSTTAATRAPFERVLGALEKDIEQGERISARALGAGFSNLSLGELLALQAGVYRYSQALEVTTKLVEKASSGVRTVVTGQ